jgi:hypothetical protein
VSLVVIGGLAAVLVYRLGAETENGALATPLDGSVIPRTHRTSIVFAARAA